VKAIDEGYVLQGYTVVHGDRQSEYDHPANDFARIAKVWSALLGVEVTPLMVSQLMIALKLCRLSYNETHEDSWVDVVGYVACADRVQRVANQIADTEPPQTVEARPASWENLEDIAFNNVLGQTPSRPDNTKGFVT